MYANFAKHGYAYFLHQIENPLNKIEKNKCKLSYVFSVWFCIFRRPTVDGWPVRGYQPVRDCKINFLDITNDALILGLSPKRDAIRFWNRILQNAQSLVH